MPSGASRTANSRAAIARPALLTQYSPRAIDAISADTEVTKTMAPANAGSAVLRAAICRASAWVRKYGPCRLMRISSSKLSSLASRMSARTRGARPALLTSALTAPYRSATAAASRARSAAAADVGLEIVGAAVERRRARGATASAPHAAQRQRPAVGGERPRDAEADASGAAGDERDCAACRLRAVTRGPRPEERRGTARCARFGGRAAPPRAGDSRPTGSIRRAASREPAGTWSQPFGR